mmetsp:Transcript_18910/g.31567  ORF Transcript_18910/g.31567 Transcript_18910/m.31567 type:complete len:1169 (-) Transcript_18910:236-3742(-)|eukprot:CAMPEP_0114425992 /NCGR_PEP_ID=MMETSP0103-20121206/7537_1 /TAXON_ID=37642 ORGANISM="Paraphysomonas imperforata, Strain PA2" /NCGR_SAMPLE_ID=MMETSP0103 /ASSEMBLY_ACC=CAM_ASM_000201 /LENGTH=1168 /DNA_ID=CAMNT_0001594877 /DNA_START=158 /DNA_END=3664 /DNA_ORIENTATION=+
MSDSDSEYNKVEESPFDDYGGPDTSAHNYDNSATKVNTKAPPESNDSYSEQNPDSFQRNSMRQMSMKFKDLITNIPSEDEDEEVSSPRFQTLETEKNEDENTAQEDFKFKFLASQSESQGYSFKNQAIPPIGEDQGREEEGHENPDERDIESGLDNDEIDIDFWKDSFIPPAPSSELSLPPLPQVTDQISKISSQPQVEPLTLDGSNEQTTESVEQENKDATIDRLLDTIPDYVGAFSESSKPQKMTVSKVPQDLVVQQMKEREEVEAKMRYTELDKVKKVEGDLLYREHVARQRVQELETVSKQRLRAEKEKMHIDFVQREYNLERDFKRAREEMETFLEKKHTVLKEEVGDLEQGKDSIGRRFKVDWTLAPQPVEMRVHTLRAAKNKLPKGAYCLMLTQYDRLGGRPLCWSKLGAYGIGTSAPATTKPFKHYGRFFDRALHVEDSMYALCPPKPDLKPSFIFVIELFQLASRNNPVDKVVAWTALPMINTQFTIVSGKIRLPLFRGEPSPSIEHFKTIEQLIADDLNNWLCNIYVEIRHLPRLESYDETKENVQGEFEIEFDFMSKLLRLNNGEKEKKDSDNEDEVDFKRAVAPRKSSVVYKADKGLFHRKLYKKRQKDVDRKQNEKDFDRSNSGFSRQSSSRSMVEESEDRGMMSSDNYDSSDSSDSDDERDQGLPNKKKEKEQVVYERGYGNGDEFSLHDFQKGKLVGIETLNSEESRQWAASGIEKGGNIVRRAQADGSRFDSESIPPRLGQKKVGMTRLAQEKGTPCDWSTPLTEQRHYDEYSMSLAPDPGQQKKLLPNAIVKTKLTFLYHEAFGDLLPSKFGTFDWYVTSVCFILAFWLRMYVHYIGQYLFLQAVQTPVYSFEVRVYEMIFKYMSSSVPVSVEFGLVALGPLGVLFVFLLLVGTGKMFYSFAGTLPDSVSLFIAAFGVATMFDSVLVMFVDVVMHNYHCGEIDDSCKVDYTSRDCECFVGDFMKLWERMVEDESSGITGLILTVIVYTGLFIVSALVLYEYMIHIHKDARVLDIWRRMSGPSEEFFIPHDFEVSYAELTSICAKAALWRGANGQTRRLAVSEYIERDPYDMDFSAVTKHYAIYENNLAGKKSLYRHFLMLPDGAIIEVFDQLSLDFSSQFKSLEKLLDRTGGGKKPKASLFGNIAEVEEEE